MGRRTGSRSRRCVNKDTVRRTEFTVFQTLVHTVNSDRADIQIFLKAHNERNLTEYEGHTEINVQLLADLIRCTKKLEADVAKLDPPADE
jgi:hypothetical protein